MKWKLIASIAMAGAMLVGCASPSTGVMQVGKNRYMISDTNSFYMKGGEVLKDILVEANAFCASKSKSVEVINAQTSDFISGVYGSGVYGGGRSAGATIEFMCE